MAASWPARRVIVVGAGVLGLTCAVRLAEAGFEVHVLARDLPLETTSAVAAALWYPYRAAPQQAVTRWARRSYEVFTELAAHEPAAGVDLVEGVELVRARVDEPWWRAAVPSLEPLSPAERPAGYGAGWRVVLPVADTSLYLPWLAARLEALGGTLTRRWLDALPDGPLVINCTGLAARGLAGDPTVYPVRGQVVLIERVRGLDRWLLDQSDDAALVYVVPRRGNVVVGGTATEGAWEREPDPATARAVLQRAVALEPRLRAAKVLGHRVGLRPARPAVRLEREDRPGGCLVHCYGHGGAGVTLSWGCAEDVVAAVAG